MSDLNADFAARAVVDTTTMDWQESPAPGVWRKRLELKGPVESGRVTSLVRFAPGSRFPAHDHPAGEEILVLDGVFSDEAGDWGPGAYLFNPEGFRHAPWSEEGCTLFVKLRQAEGRDRAHVTMETRTAPFQETGIDGLTCLPLYAEPGYPERVALYRFAPHCRVPYHDHAGGEEGFVLDGTFIDENGRHPAGTWFRNPPGAGHSVWTEADGCTVFAKTDHLSALA